MRKHLKEAGGIGISVTKVRATAPHIRGSGGSSNGLVPMLRVFDAPARSSVGRRQAKARLRVPRPWHAGVEVFLDMKKNHGKEAACARPRNAWVPDLFMKRVEDNGTWTLFCPDECPGLDTSYGDEFESSMPVRGGRARSQDHKGAGAVVPDT